MNIPNLLTLLRVALIPVFILLFYLPFSWSYWAASGVFAIAAVTDWLDGYLARRRGQVSNFGKLIDPVADKLLALSLMIFFSVQGTLPLWYTLVFLWRELVITALRSVAASEGTVISASTAGKRKTVYLNIGLGFLFVPPMLWIIPARWIAWVFLLIALGYCLLSAWHYCRDFYQSILKNQL